MSHPKAVFQILNNLILMIGERVLDQIKKYMITHHEAGDKLPSMKNLASILNVSTNTIRRAVNEMVEQGNALFARGESMAGFI